MKRLRLGGIALPIAALLLTGSAVAFPSAALAWCGDSSCTTWCRSTRWYEFWESGGTVCHTFGY
jgi:hypothetical protein